MAFYGYDAGGMGGGYGGFPQFPQNAGYGMPGQHDHWMQQQHAPNPYDHSATYGSVQAQTNSQQPALFHKGQKVLAFWTKTNEWYPATVVQGPLADGDYEIQWDDGDTFERKKAPHLLKALVAGQVPAAKPQAQVTPVPVKTAAPAPVPAAAPAPVPPKPAAPTTGKKFEIDQDVDAKKPGGDAWLPGHILRFVDGNKYVVAWDNHSTAPAATLPETDIRVPTFKETERIKARWNHDQKWYDAVIMKKLQEGKYLIEWNPAQPDDREKTPKDMKRIWAPPPPGCCVIS